VIKEVLKIAQAWEFEKEFSKSCLWHRPCDIEARKAGPKQTFCSNSLCFTGVGAAALEIMKRVPFAILRNCRGLGQKLILVLFPLQSAYAENSVWQDVKSCVAEPSQCLRIVGASLKESATSVQSIFNNFALYYAVSKNTPQSRKQLESILALYVSDATKRSQLLAAIEEIQKKQSQNQDPDSTEYSRDLLALLGDPRYGLSRESLASLSLQLNQSGFLPHYSQIEEIASLQKPGSASGEGDVARRIVAERGRERPSEEELESVEVAENSSGASGKVAKSKDSVASPSETAPSAVMGPAPQIIVSNEPSAEISAEASKASAAQKEAVSASADSSDKEVESAPTPSRSIASLEAKDLPVSMASNQFHLGNHGETDASTDLGPTRPVQPAVPTSPAAPSAPTVKTGAAVANAVQNVGADLAPAESFVTRQFDESLGLESSPSDVAKNSALAGASSALNFELAPDRKAPDVHNGVPLSSYSPPAPAPISYAPTSAPVTETSSTTPPEVAPSPADLLKRERAERARLVRRILDKEFADPKEVQGLEMKLCRDFLQEQNKWSIEAARKKLGPEARCTAIKQRWQARIETFGKSKDSKFKPASEEEIFSASELYKCLTAYQKVKARAQFLVDRGTKYVKGEAEAFDITSFTKDLADKAALEASSRMLVAVDPYDILCDSYNATKAARKVASVDVPAYKCEQDETGEFQGYVHTNGKLGYQRFKQTAGSHYVRSAMVMNFFKLTYMSLPEEARKDPVPYLNHRLANLRNFGPDNGPSSKALYDFSFGKCRHLIFDKETCRGLSWNAVKGVEHAFMRSKQKTSRILDYVANDLIYGADEKQSEAIVETFRTHLCQDLEGDDPAGLHKI
jgi:hypothetical protein